MTTAYDVYHHIIKYLIFCTPEILHQGFVNSINSKINKHGTTFKNCISRIGN